jgi:HemY protein
MRRLLTFLVLTGLAVAGAVWLADRPGTVTIRWEGWRLDTTVPVLLLFLAAFVAVLALAARVLRAVFGAPGHFFAARRMGRERKGYAALADGLAAALSGDALRAGKLARKADKLLKNPAVTGLLTAQAAQLSGDEAAMRDRFATMTERKETAFLGHKGLADLALRTGDRASARDEAGKAFVLRPEADGLARQLLDLHMEAGAWAEADQVLRTARRRNALPEAELIHTHALILFGRAEAALKAGNEGEALDWAMEARDADPLFAPATALAAGLCHHRGKDRKATSLLKSAFKAAPHPLLVEGWRALGGDRAPLQRVKWMQELAQTNPTSPDAHLALAEASLDAQLWGQARSHGQEALTQRPSRAAYQLMARVEREERKDEAAAAAWLAKAAADSTPEPSWACAACGHHAADFTVTCPSCGAAGRLEWS